jgi:hypothetical protein
VGASVLATAVQVAGPLNRGVLSGSDASGHGSTGDDPIDDRTFLEGSLAHVYDLWTWTMYCFGAVFETVTPPTPVSMIKHLQDDSQQSAFFKFIGYAGYKIKEIENGVGLPPDINVTFVRIQNLSEADEDFIERELQRWKVRDSGLLADAQRSVITTLTSINAGSSYRVDSLKVRVLPLPQVKFTLAPAEGGLSAEHSILLRAIQHLDSRQNKS